MAQSEGLQSETLERTPLFNFALENKAKLIDFAGWEMPVYYTSIKKEHEAVRTSVGIFDVSHMGKFFFQGKDLVKQLQFLVPSDLERLKPGFAQYTVLLNETGGIIDDIIFYYQGENQDGQQQGIMIVNSSTKAKDKAWILKNLENTSVELIDNSHLVLISIAGKDALNKLNTLVEHDLTSLPTFGHLETKLLGSDGFIARTGYTGEDGFEIMVEKSIGVKLWEKLIDMGVTPCGLGARDTLRLEANLCLYGQDINETTTPLEAGLSWLVHLNSKKQDFIGKKILEEQKKNGVNRRLVSLEMKGRYIARHGYPVLSNGKVIGEITSGTLSPTLGQGIALAYVPKSLSKIGQQLEIEIRGKNHPATIVKKPFYKSLNR